MKSKQYKSLGLVVNLSVPETVEEFDANAKSAGACLNEATNNVIYRGSLTEFRSVLIHGAEADTERNLPGFKGLEEIYSFPRKTKAVLDKDQKPKVVDGEPVTQPDETEQEYIDRLLAEKSLKVEDLQQYADQAAAVIVFDASARERKAPTPKKLPQMFVDAATSLLANKDDATINKAIQKYLPETSFTRTDDTAKNIQALGVIIRDFQKAKLAAGVL